MKQLLFLLVYVINFQVHANLGGVLCQLPRNEGYRCGSFVPSPAYHFDVNVGECIQFIFEGCGGNQNRFVTKEECEDGCGALAKCGKGLPLMDFAGNLKRCTSDKVPCPGGYDCIGSGKDTVCCRKADRICNMKVDVGKTCGLSDTRFFFDASANLCRPFTYHGCNGNENNFKTKGDCLKFCAKQIGCLKGDPWPDRYAVNRVATCHTNKDCPQNYTCMIKSTRPVCCPSVDFVCSSEYESKTTCRLNLPPSRNWAFNVKTGQCEQVKMCIEQLNSFASLEQCLDFCVGTCPGGAQPHINPFTNQPQMCSKNVAESCPLGYECIQTSKYSAICCLLPPACPAPESIMQTYEHTDEAVKCLKENSTCARGYTCQKASNKEHICCTPAYDCPYGMSVLREQFNHPHLCTPGVVGTCPKDGYICTKISLESQSAKHICCLPEKKCIIPYVSPDTKKAIKCTPGGEACPANTGCMKVGENTPEKGPLTFYCCSDVQVHTCPDGSMPLQADNSSKPKRCSSESGVLCPVGFTCQKLIDDSFACCPVKISTNVCRYPIMQSNGSLIPCNSETDTTSCKKHGRCRQTLDLHYHCCRN